MTTSATRQIKGKKFNIVQLIDDAFTAFETGTYNVGQVNWRLNHIGITNPTPEQLREFAILNTLEYKTNTRFLNQFGRNKIDCSTRESALDGVNAYLTRRHGAMQRDYKRSY